MTSDLGELRITAAEIEDVTDLSSSNIFALDAYRAFILRRPKAVISVVLTEIFALVLILILVMPVSFVVLRNSGKLPGDMMGITWSFTIILGFSVLGILIGNIYLWRQAKQLKSLAKLLDEVERYNGTIQALTLIDELESVGHSTTQLHRFNAREVVEALTVIKESLVSALRVERILRKHESFIEGRYELLSNLENSLNTLMSFEMSDRASEYGRLLHESLQIGLSVHKEMRKLQHQKST